MDDTFRITEWLDPSKETICPSCGETKSKYGRISNHEWLELERKRVQSCGKKCEIKSINDKEALFYKDGSYVDGEWVTAKDL